MATFGFLAQFQQVAGVILCNSEGSLFVSLSVSLSTGTSIESDRSVAIVNNRATLAGWLAYVSKVISPV